jgi:acetyl-CoA carboxylase carboxyl transferase subunit alpha
LWAPPKAAAALRITSTDLAALKLVDEVVKEPLGGAHNDHDAAAASLKEALLRNLDEVRSLPVGGRLKARYAKFRAFGRFTEPLRAAA